MKQISNEQVKGIIQVISNQTGVMPPATVVGILTLLQNLPDVTIAKDEKEKGE